VGFCQPGQIMAAVDLLTGPGNPTGRDIDAIENVWPLRNLRSRIREAIKQRAALMP